MPRCGGVKARLAIEVLDIGESESRISFRGRPADQLLNRGGPIPRGIIAFGVERNEHVRCIQIMVKGTVELSALQFLPERLSLKSLREASRGCQGCPLFQNATQTVFGQGSRSSRIILIGEQPGNDEDLKGEPFVGPAGRVLDQALEAAGIDRGDTYVTNVVKHFKWEPKGKRRMHKKPNAREIAACIPWLEKEIELIKPEVLVCLGATAAQALLGRDFRVTVDHGKILDTRLASHAIATIHPSAVLRQRTAEDRERELRTLTQDLGVVAALIDGRVRQRRQ